MRGGVCSLKEGCRKGRRKISKFFPTFSHSAETIRRDGSRALWEASCRPKASIRGTPGALLFFSRLYLGRNSSALRPGWAPDRKSGWTHTRKAEYPVRKSGDPSGSHSRAPAERPAGAGGQWGRRSPSR